MNTRAETNAKVVDKLSWNEENATFYDCVSNALEKSLESACLEYINYCLAKGMVLMPHPWLFEAKAFLENRC